MWPPWPPAPQLLRWYGFSAEFRNHMVYPLTALFFGTGNQTPNVASAVVARVFLDPKLRLFDYSPDRLLSSVPVRLGWGEAGRAVEEKQGGNWRRSVGERAVARAESRRRRGRKLGARCVTWAVRLGGGVHAQDMYAFPLLQDIFTTVAARAGYQLHCSRAVRRVQRSVRGDAGPVLATDDKGVTVRIQGGREGGGTHTAAAPLQHQGRAGLTAKQARGSPGG